MSIGRTKHAVKRGLHRYLLLQGSSVVMYGAKEIALD